MPTPASSSGRPTPRRRRCATPQYYQYDFDIAEHRRGVAPRQRRGVVAARPHCRSARGRSAAGRLRGTGVRLGEGRWTVEAAIETARPPTCSSAALFDRFASQGEAEFADKVLSAMRKEFGGHEDEATDERPRRPGRRAGHVRRHRRPGPQEAVPCAVPAGAPRPARPPGHRRGPFAVEPTTTSATTPREAIKTAGRHRPTTRPLHAPRRPPDAWSPASTPIAGTYEQLADTSRQLRAAGALPGHPARRCSTTSCRGWPSVELNQALAVVVEKPFGRDLESARELNAILHRRLRRVMRSSASTTTSARSPSRTCSCSVSPTPSSNRCGTATTSTSCRSPWRRPSGSRDAARFYDAVGTIRDVVQNHLLQVVALPGHGAAGRQRRRRAARRDRQGAPRRSPRRLTGDVGAGPVPAATSTRRGWRRTRRSRPTPPWRLQIDSWRWAGVPFVIRAGKGLAATATEAVVEFQAPPRLLFADRHHRPHPNVIRFRMGHNDGVTIRAGQGTGRPRWPAARSTSRSTSPRRSDGARRPTNGCSTTRSTATPPLRPRGHRRGAVAHRGRTSSTPTDVAGAPLHERHLGTRTGGPAAARPRLARAAEPLSRRAARAAEPPAPASRAGERPPGSVPAWPCSGSTSAGRGSRAHRWTPPRGELLAEPVPDPHARAAPPPTRSQRWWPTSSRHFAWHGADRLHLSRRGAGRAHLHGCQPRPAWVGLDADALFTNAPAAPVTLMNDADAAGLAEMHFGAGRGRHDVVLILLTLGTGIGSALFHDGRSCPTPSSATSRSRQPGRRTTSGGPGPRREEAELEAVRGTRQRVPLPGRKRCSGPI